MASRAVAVPIHVTFDGRKVDKDEVVAFGGRGRFGEQGDDPLQTQAELPASGVYDGSSISSPLGARASMTAQVISWSRLYRTTRAACSSSNVTAVGPGRDCTEWCSGQSVRRQESEATDRDAGPQLRTGAMPARPNIHAPRAGSGRAGGCRKAPSGVTQASHFRGTNCGASLVTYCFYCSIGGEGGIRTLDGLSPIHTFQACSFDRSDTSPRALLKQSAANWR